MDKWEILTTHHFAIAMVRLIERNRNKIAACLMLACIICRAFMRSPVSSR